MPAANDSPPYTLTKYTNMDINTQVFDNPADK